jgi:hypothetical protein
VRSRQFERRRGVPESPREPVSETLAALLAREPNDGSRSGLCGWQGSLLWLWLGYPRTRSPLPHWCRFRHRLISAISSL